MTDLGGPMKTVRPDAMDVGFFGVAVWWRYVYSYVFDTSSAPSISTGGDPIRLYKMKRPDRPVNIVALLDVSGPMLVYSRVFLAFLKGLDCHDQKTDAYRFHTSLARVSDVMRDTDTLRAVNRLSLMAQGFRGCRRIAQNLQCFNQQYAAHSVIGRSVVIIFSDGYDTNPPELMAKALARLKRRGCRII